MIQRMLETSSEKVSSRRNLETGEKYPKLRIKLRAFIRDVRVCDPMFGSGPVLVVTRNNRVPGCNFGYPN